MSRSIHLRFGELPSGLASYPRVVLTGRQAITDVSNPPEFRAHVERVKLSAEQIARYAQVCGYGDAQAVPLTYPHVLATPLHLRIFATEAFPLRPMGLIHLANRIELLGEIHAGMTVAVDVAVRRYRETDAGIAFDFDSEISSRGRVLWRETCVFLSRWPEQLQRPPGRPARPPKVPKDARVLGSEIDVSLRTTWDYARVSHDFNPIHLSDLTARIFGLRGAISHGMWSLARSLATEPRGAPAPGARLETQFLTPVQLPAKVTVKEWDEEGARRLAMCDARNGRVHVYAYWAPAAC